MKTIKIKTLGITNFKNIRSLTVDFNQNGETTIAGENATGKTTIFDAFTWLLFDKDSQGNSKFEIKTVDPETGKAIPQVEHEVFGLLDIDGREVTLRKVYREKWTTRRGSAETEMTGHETVYFYDGIKVAAGEYQRRIADIAPDELFKLTTDPAHFNRLSTADKRNVLISIAGEITNEMVEKMRPDLAGIMALVNGYKPEEIKQKLSYQKNLIKKEFEMIPARIDEKEREKGEPDNWDEIQKEIKERTQELETINRELEDIQESSRKNNQELKGLYSQIADLDREEFKAKAEERMKVDAWNAEQRAKPDRINYQISAAQKRITRAESQIKEIKHQTSIRHETIDALSAKNNELRKKWSETDSEIFVINPEELTCPTCGQDYPIDKAEQMRELSLGNFNKNKIEKLAEIEKQGIHNRNKIEQLILENKEDQETLEILIAEIEEAQRDIRLYEAELKETNLNIKEYNFDEIKELQTIEAKKAEVVAKIETLSKQLPEDKIQRAQQQRAAVQQELLNANRLYARKDQIDTADARIAELLKQQKEMAQAIADIEKQEFMVAEFMKTKLSEIEAAVNRKFKIVRFRLFRPQVNGGEEQVCDATVAGVPFDSLNSAMKINSGIDIINALTNHYQFRAPIFIDNRETVNELEPSESQIINLKVTRDKKLKIS